MLAYVFWHRPRADVDVAAYEQALVAFQRSLAHSPPIGMRGSAVFRVPEIPWLSSAAFGEETGAGGGYEDWYLIDDFAALGVLNEAAVGRGHRTSHDQAAHGLGAGAAGLYRLIEREPSAAARIAETSTGIWIARPPGSPQSALGALLGDGMGEGGMGEGGNPIPSSLWQRQLVFGPAPEFCLLARERPPGVAPARLPAGWSARAVSRETLFPA